MNKPIISVIIPTYHRNELLRKCLDCLNPGVQTLPAEQYEVIVTDDGSKTTAEEMIRKDYPWVKWVVGPRQGPAANRNNGASYAQGEWLVFTDDDCLPQPNWLNAFAQATKGEALALEGAIHPLGDPEQDMAECPINLNGGCFWSANIAIERALFEKIGGFDPNYPLAAHEDVDMKLRLFKLTTISFIPDASVVHPVRILPFKYLIARIPKQCAAWAYHANKNRKALGYEKTLSLPIDQYKFHLLGLMRNFRSRRFKAACSSLIMLIFGIPLILVYLRRLETTNQRQSV